MADKTITQLTDIGEAIADSDELAIYNASGTATRKTAASRVKTYATNVDIVGLTAASGGPVVGDSLPIYDLSATANRKVTLTDVKALMTDVDINGLNSATPATADSVVIYDADASANRKATVSDLIALVSGAKFAKSFSPLEAVFPSSGFAALTMVNGRMVLAFDATSDEYVDFVFAMSPVATGVIDTCRVYYTMASATSGAVALTVEVEAVTTSDALDLDATTSFDTANSASLTVPGTAGYMLRHGITLTNADSVALDDYVRVRIKRDADAGGDTASGDLYVLAVQLYDA